MRHLPASKEKGGAKGVEAHSQRVQECYINEIVFSIHAEYIHAAVGSTRNYSDRGNIQLSQSLFFMHFQLHFCEMKTVGPNLVKCIQLLRTCDFRV